MNQIFTKNKIKWWIFGNLQFQYNYSEKCASKCMKILYGKQMTIPTKSKTFQLNATVTTHEKKLARFRQLDFGYVS